MSEREQDDTGRHDGPGKGETRDPREERLEALKAQDREEATVESALDDPARLDADALGIAEAELPSGHLSATEKKIDEGYFESLVDKSAGVKDSVLGVDQTQKSDVPGHLFGGPSSGMVATGQDHSGSGDSGGGSEKPDKSGFAEVYQEAAVLKLLKTKGLLEEDPNAMADGGGTTIDMVTGEVTIDEQGMAEQGGDVDPPHHEDEPGDGSTIDVVTGERTFDERHYKSGDGTTDPELGEEPQTPLTEDQVDLLAGQGGGAAGPIDEPPDAPVGEGEDPHGGGLGPEGPDTPYADTGHLGGITADASLEPGEVGDAAAQAFDDVEFHG